MYKDFVKYLSRGQSLFMVLGNGSKKQYKRLKTEVHAIVDTIVAEMKKSPNPALLYFGDPPNPQKPDIGMVFSYIAETYPEIPIYMIQIDAAKEWGVPKFVKNAFFHGEYADGEFKWGGVDTSGTPRSNTKIWSNLHRDVGIKKVFAIGGGDIAKQEVALARKLGIVARQFKATPKY